MKCSKCGSIIPDDSQFCPDCGELIKNISTIRQSANDLVQSNKYGYGKVVVEGLIPQFSEYLSIEGYEKILSISDKIIKLQKEFDYEQSEERKKEIKIQEELIHCRSLVSQIYSNYYKGYQILTQRHVLPIYSEELSLSDCQRVLTSKKMIIEETNKQLERERKQQQEAQRRKEKEEARLKEDRRRLESLRHEVKSLYNSYTEGYKYAVSHARIPNYTAGLSVEQCEKILKLKEYIVDKQKIAEKEQRREDNWSMIIIGLLLKNPAISFSITGFVFLCLIVISQITTIDITVFSLFGLSPLVSLCLLIYGILCIIDIIKVVADN